MLRLPQPTVLFWWYFIGWLCFAPRAARGPSHWRVPAARRPRTALFLAFELLSMTLFFAASKRLPAPLTSFLAESHMLFVVLLGTWLLGERFAPAERLGAALMVAGVALIGWTRRAGALEWVAVLLFAELAWAASHVAAKTLLEEEDPFRLAHLRCAAFLVVSAAWALAAGAPFAVRDPAAAGLLLLGGVAGPYCNMVFRYQALRTLDVSKVSLVTAQHPAVVLALSSAFGLALPDPRELAGGLLALSGTVLLVGHGARARAPLPPAADDPRR